MKTTAELIQIAKENGATSVTIDGVTYHFSPTLDQMVADRSSKKIFPPILDESVFENDVLKQEISDEDMLLWSVPLPDEAKAQEIDAEKVDNT